MSPQKRIAVYVLLSALLVAGLSASQAQERPLSARVRGLNNSLLRIQSQMRRAARADQAAIRNQAQPVIEERAAGLASLIEQDAGQALSLAFSPDFVSDLAVQFPESATLLETRGTWQGTAETWSLCSPDGSHRSVAHLKSGEETLEVYFSPSEPTALSQGGAMQVSGIRVGNKVAASSVTVDSSTATTTTATTAACSATGAQNTIVLMVAFPNTPLPAGVTLQSVQDVFFGTSGYSLNGYWTEASYGKTSATGQVYPNVLTLSTDYTCSTTDQMRAEAVNLAAAAGVNLQSYSRLFMVVPDMGCGWAGAANMTCTTLSAPGYSFNASTAYISASQWASTTPNAAAVTVMHEGGHNLGLNHSRSRAFGTEALGATGTEGNIQEYSDPFTAMSSGGSGHYDAPHKAEILNWLTPSNYQVVQSGGTWTIAPIEVLSTGLQALKIQRGTGNNAWLWVEYRQPVGIYDGAYASNHAWSNQVFSGAVIHYEDSFTTDSYSDLLDFTPSSSYGFWDPALAAGQTWNDPYSNVSITVLSAIPSGLTVSVSYGSTPCTQANPTLSIAPPNPSVAAGSNVSYTISLTNNNSSACPASTFNLSSQQPSGWSGTFSAPSLTAGPGQTVTASLTENVPATAAAATYALSASAANGAFAASASANCTVTSSSAPVLTDTLSVGSSTYTRKQTASMSSTVLSSGSAVSGATVTFTLTKSNGSKVTGKVTSGSNGIAAWQYRFSSKDPTGTYSVSSSAAYGTQTATSNVVSFTVK